MKKHVLDIVMAMGLALSLAVGSFGGFSQECEALQHEVLRLHIPANSDSDYDQQMKLRLRDFVLEHYGTQLACEGDFAAAREKIALLLPQIEESCNEFLRQNGATYSAAAELTEMYFTTRRYGNAALPAGTYTALRIVLGSGEGQNWWCVMFPPLCIPMAADCEQAAALLPEELSDTDGGSVEVKLALFEFFKRLISGN